MRQFESLVRDAKGVARLRSHEKLKVDQGQVDFDLQVNSLQRVERENVDLGAVLGEVEPADAPDGGAVGSAPADGVGAAETASPDHWRKKR